VSAKRHCIIQLRRECTAKFTFINEDGRRTSEARTENYREAEETRKKTENDEMATVERN